MKTKLTKHNVLSPRQRTLATGMEAGACTDQETDGHSVTVSTALCLDSIALLLLSL